MKTTCILLFSIHTLFFSFFADAFVATVSTGRGMGRINHYSNNRPLFASGMDPETAKLLANAKALLEKAKTDLEVKDAQQEQQVNLDATMVPKSNQEQQQGQGAEKKLAVTKQMLDTGLITTDGELMAALSEDEDWSERALADLFKDETFEDMDTPSDTVLGRDVAQSINALRVKMENGDFAEIFNQKNYFIGEN
mmetsp:Transcript_23609/g.35445  ORF Transcript_23609/g.35445 Transcript_23609/m.35445 type:complete len:195 (-) Transcript_23609:284-868(-)|eukprot:CAMPEP_0116020824 /NCGR_PEP_ID=MMETSP0321-20121206/10027_1 /TAXON_ID=163516 /ORGANISM="Leptocylindrus danicus var. danicus, Strain B650" /LENGTH=194 /DNA_ID=CAMNT_0003491589 /DNA_START=122 /DNA_END=706 /DNA_ORIENTATION=-